MQVRFASSLFPCLETKARIQRIRQAVCLRALPPFVWRIRFPICIWIGLNYIFKIIPGCSANPRIFLASYTLNARSYKARLMETHYPLTASAPFGTNFYEHLEILIKIEKDSALAGVSAFPFCPNLYWMPSPRKSRQ